MKINRDFLEKALLLCVVRDKNWNVLILNNITDEYFTLANKQMYQYIKECADKNEYPDFKLLGYQFNIDDVYMQECLTITNLNELCDLLRKEYLSMHLNYEISGLNEHRDEMIENPQKYIDRIGTLYDNLKVLGHQTKSVSLFENIEDILSIDSSNVISSGFPELDKKLIGWKRGEELVVFMGRTGQGKSWMGLKFAFSAALQGERVGIYSGEMSILQLQERILCCAKQSYVSTKEDALNYIKQNNIDIRVLTQKELRRRATVDDIEAFIIRDNLTMLVIDQLSLMEDNSADAKFKVPMRQQYGNISMDLFTLSSRYSLPIILLVQSNRQGSDQKNGPALENIAESDAVAQNATRVISMKNENGVLTLNVLKNRYGDSKMVQRYDVDFSINKYKPELIPEYDNKLGINQNISRSLQGRNSVIRNNRDGF